jgi:hypothetical protein
MNFTFFLHLSGLAFTTDWDGKRVFESNSETISFSADSWSKAKERAKDILTAKRDAHVALGGNLVLSTHDVGPGGITKDHNVIVSFTTEAGVKAGRKFHSKKA